MSVILNGNTYELDDFVGTDGRGYTNINPATGKVFFPDSVFDDMLAEIASSLASYDVSAFVAGLPGSSDVVFRFIAVRPVTFADDFLGSDAHARVAATALTTFDVQKNGVNIGDIQFAISAVDGTFLTDAGSVSLAAGDRLEIVAPASADATLEDIAITFMG